MNPAAAPNSDLHAFLLQSGLAMPGSDSRWTPLAGGVSADIWRVDIESTTICIKRALARLKVHADWQAPVSRNAVEWDYLQWAERIAPGQVPHPIAHDPARGVFAMAWLPPERHRQWKAALLAGEVDPADAVAVGDLLGRLHAASARDPKLATRFATDANFHALRIEPYLLAVGAAHPELAGALTELARSTASTRKVLAHGDVSPKNILLGPAGPVLLDAECAWFGDPAFDLAFCLTHLTVKQMIVTRSSEALQVSFSRLRAAYLARVDWEPPETLERRAAKLLPALALARACGKSPLEYLTTDQRTRLSTAAAAALLAAPRTLSIARALLTGLSSPGE